jgi:hypothetical protein
MCGISILCTPITIYNFVCYEGGAEQLSAKPVTIYLAVDVGRYFAIYGDSRLK